MQCCECAKIIDMTQKEIPPKWFAKYEGWKLIKLICADCIKVPEKLVKWVKE